MRPIPLQNQFSAGMKRDSPRNRMSPSSAWNIIDMILDYGAPARERGGWANASDSISAVTSTADHVAAGIYAIFSPTAGAAPRNVAIDEDGICYLIATGGGVTVIGTALPVLQNPVFHGGAAASAASAIYTGLVIIPVGTTAAPKKYDGTSLSSLNGSPPFAKFATVYRDYTVLANGAIGGTTYPNRMWFSPAGDPDAGFSGAVTAWDTADAWIDFSLPIEGLAATKSALLVFHDNQISRIRGSNPPPDEDMVVDDPAWKIGLLDPFSLTEHQDQIYWCAPEGIFRTDGVSVDNITLKGGMLRYWLDLQVAATTAWTFATGIIRENLVVSIMNGSTFVDAFLINMSNYAFSRVSNLRASSFWDGLYNSADEEYFGRRNADFVGRLDPMFQVGNATYKADGDGTAVASILETAFYEMGQPGLKIIKNVYCGFSLADFATDNPSIAVSYIKTPEGETYTSLGTFLESATYARQRLTIGGRMYGVAFKFARANAGDFFGYDIAVDAMPLELSKR